MTTYEKKDIYGMSSASHFLLRERNDTMKIHLIRHGQVNHNLYGIYSNVDEDLNETGIRQALTLKEKVNNIIYSSPLIRAKHTAEIINSAHKQILTDDRLNRKKSRQSIRTAPKGH